MTIANPSLPTVSELSANASGTRPATAVDDVQSILRELHGVIDAREQLAAQDKPLSERRMALEAKLREFHDVTGLDSVKGAGLTIGFDSSAMRTKYDPELWPGIVKWAVASGNDHIIQRRLTDAKVIELIKNGTPLPEGLTVETYLKLSVRRV